MDSSENQRPLVTSSNIAWWTWVDRIGKILGYILALIAIVAMLVTLFRKPHFTIDGGLYRNRLSNYNKIQHWRRCIFSNDGKPVQMVSAYEKITDSKGNIVSTLQAEIILENGEHSMFSNYEINGFVQRSVLFEQVESDFIELRSSEIYKITLSYTYKYEYMYMSTKYETKSDTSSIFMLKSGEIPILHQNLTPEQILTKGLELHLMR